MPLTEKQLQNMESNTTNTVTKPEKSLHNYEELLLENNRLLKKLVHHQKWAMFFGFLKAILFIGPLILAYLYLPPLINQIINNYQSALSGVDNLKEIQGNLDQLKNATSLDFLKGLNQNLNTLPKTK